MHLSTMSTQTVPEIRKLRNGVTVLLEPLPYFRSVTAGVWVRAGSGNEPAPQAGISHFLEHLFFKGTATRTARQLMEAIESRGGHLNAFTSRDYTCVYVKTIDTATAGGIEILADILKNSQFFDLDKERNVVLEEIASIEDVPEDLVHDVFAARLWPNHPLGQPITGTQETVSGMCLEDIRAYYGAWYKPENLIVGVVGGFDEDAVLRQVTEEFECIVPAAPPATLGPPRANAGLEWVDKDIAQNHLCFGFPGPAVTDSRRYIYEILSCVLGGGSTSRLFDKIREDAGLAYSIYTFLSTYVSAGMLGVYAAVAPENLGRALDLSYTELRKLRDEPLGRAELDMNREQVKVGLLMALENPFNRLSRLVKTYMYHGRIIPVDETLTAIDAVTAEQVQGLAREVLTQERCNLVVLGPEGQPQIAGLSL